MKFNWSFNHLGMMVTDRDEVLEYYQSIGLGVSVGPQPLLPYIEGEGEITFFRELDGDPVSHKYQMEEYRGNKIAPNARNSNGFGLLQSRTKYQMENY